MLVHELPVVPFSLPAVVLVELSLMVLLGRWYLLFPVALGS